LKFWSFAKKLGAEENAGAGFKEAREFLFLSEKLPNRQLLGVFGD
jgi:hypothetical protein